MHQLDQDELASVAYQVKLYGDCFEAGHPGHAKFEDFVWYFVDCMPVADMAPGRQEAWAQWMQKEMARAAEEGVPDRYRLFLESNPEGWDPVVVVEGRDGRFYVWVGHHRVGAAVMRDLKTLEALVGLRRPIG